MFEINLSKTDLDLLKTVDFEFSEKSYRLINLNFCRPKGFLIDLKASDMTRQIRLRDWIDEILEKFRKKFPRKKSHFLKDVNQIVSFDYIFYFRIDIKPYNSKYIPICYLIFVKDFEKCESEVIDLRALVEDNN